MVCRPQKTTIPTITKRKHPMCLKMSHFFLKAIKDVNTKKFKGTQFQEEMSPSQVSRDQETATSVPKTTTQSGGKGREQRAWHRPAAALGKERPASLTPAAHAPRGHQLSVLTIADTVVDGIGLGTEAIPRIQFLKSIWKDTSPPRSPALSHGTWLRLSNSMQGTERSGNQQASSSQSC